LTHDWLRRALLMVALGLASGCSRSSGGGDGAAQGQASARTTASPTASAAPEVPSAGLGGAPVPTPEDAEEDAAHRITDQNLESELDRLEREIQAE
jgi:hypothetical protein